MSVPVSLLVLTRNEEDHIADCLASASWVDEMVVVDSGSTDRTVALAEEAGARVLEHAFESHARQRNWGLEQLSHRWVLVLDADERATPELAAEVPTILERGDRYAAFRISRRNWLMDGFVRHGSWGRDRVVRLIDRERCSFPDRRIHETVEARGPMAEMRSHILHYTCQDLQDFLRRADTYARLGAQDAADRGTRAGWGRLLGRPIFRFLRSYLLLWGFLDGRRGLVQASLTAYGAWLKYLYLYELEARERKGRK